MPFSSPLRVVIIVLATALSSQAQWNLLSKPTNSVFDVQFINENIIYACGAKGAHKSIDGGVTWSQSSQFLSLDEGGLVENLYFSFSVFYDLHFINEQVGYAAGWSLATNSEIIIKTVNGGDSWTISLLSQVSGDEVGQGITSIQFTDAQTGYASSFKGRILKTTDGGSHWSLLNTSTTANLKGLQFFNNSDGIAMGDNTMVKTTNGGSSWTVSSLSNTVQAFYFTDINTGFVSAGNERMLRTSNGGSTWSENDMAMLVTEIFFTNSQTGYAAGMNLYKTIDSGITWFLQAQRDYDEITSIRFANSKVGMASTFSGQIYKTTNGGNAATPPVKLTSFTPSMGLPGSSVTVTGENLEYVNAVSICGLSAKFRISSGTLYTSIPEDALNDAKIELQSVNGSVFSSENLVLIRTPYFYSFAPLNALDGSTITLTGYNFSSATAVSFNEIPTTFTVVDNTTIMAVVPAGNASGTIKVTTPFGSVTSQGSFTKYEVPVITSFTPQTNYRDGFIWLSGKFLSNTSVALNGVSVPAQVVSDTLIKVFGLPDDATSGKFSVKNLAATGYSADVFIVKEGSPSIAISNFTPTSGKMSQEVTIYGQDFLSLKKLMLNEIELSFSVVSNTEIITEIPVFAQSGTFYGLDWDGNPITLTSTPFTVQAGSAIPIVDGFTPSSGVIQNRITIRGKNLYDVSGVLFNGVRSEFWYRNGFHTLYAEIPALATTGKISLESNAGNATSTDDFVVISNYCTPIHINLSQNTGITPLFIGNAHFNIDATSQYKNFYDSTSQIIEAKPGSTVSLFVKTNGSFDQPMFLVYIDWNNDKDFFDDDELVHVSSQTQTFQNTFSQFTIPSGAPTNATLRMRVHARQRLYDLSTVTPCDMVGTGLAVDFTLKMVSNFTYNQPTVSSIAPTTVTYGTKIKIAGTNLVHTQKVFIDNIAASFSYNNATNLLEVIIPSGTNAGELLIVTKSSPLQIKNQLYIIPTPNINEFELTQDTVGARVKINLFESKTASSITSVSFNGIPAQTIETNWIYVYADVPPNAKSGKISVTNQFGTYELNGNFTVIREPTIASIFPTSAHMGDHVLINGTEFNGITHITVNGVPVVTFKVISPTQISFKVPFGASHGKVQVVNKKATGTSSGVLTILKSEGTATFREIPSFNYGSISQVDWTINKALDFNSDGFMDLVVPGVLDVTSRSSGFITVYLSKGDGTFEDTNLRIAGYDFDIGDFNGDGFNDIITQDSGGYKLYHNGPSGLKRKADAFFNLIPLDPQWWDHTIPSIERVADLDSDGDLDVLIRGSAIAWLEQINKTFTIHYIDLPYQGGPIEYEDFDKDGDMDIFRSDEMYINTNGTYTKSDWITLDYLTYRSMMTTDVNADGYPDVIATFDSYRGNNIVVLKNVDGKRFEMSDFGGLSNPVNFTIGDVYNKGTLDVLTRIWYGTGINKIDFEVFSIPTSGDASLTEIFPFTGYEEDDFFLDYWAAYNLLDFENDGDLDFFQIGALLPRARLFENYTRNNNAGAYNASPNAPTILSIDRVSNTEVILRWNNGNDDHTPQASLNYNILVLDNASGLLKLPPKPLGTAYGNAGMSNQWRLKNLDPNVTYSFQVQAIDMGYRASSFSDPVSFMLSSVLLTPTELTSTVLGSNSVKLQWKDNSSDETGFIIEYKKSSASNFEILTSVNADVVQVTVNALMCNENYDFRIKANNAVSVSQYSNIAKAKTSDINKPTIAGPLTFCEGETTTLTTSMGYSEYHWSTGNASSSIIVNQPGEYSVTIKDNSGCEKSNSVIVTKTPIPNVSVEINGSQMIASIADSYQWYKDGVVQPGTTNTFTVESAGVYKVKVTQNGCSAFSEEITFTITDVEGSLSQSIHLTPNPSSGLVTITTPAMDGELTIVNQLGIEIYRIKINKDDKSLTIDLSDKSSGLYLLKFYKGNYVQSQRLVLLK